MEGPYGRNNGAVVWGDIKGGKLTYLAGVFDNAAVATSPLFSGRVRLALWDPEPGFWGNGSYFGDKDLLSIGVGGAVPEERQHGRDGPEGLGRGQRRRALREEARRRLVRDRRRRLLPLTTSTTAA